MTCPTPTGHVVDLLPPGASPGLEAVSTALRAYAASPVGDGLPAWNDLVRVTRELRPDHLAPHVDLRHDVDVRLPHAVAAEFEELAATLTRITPPGGGTDHLRGYHDEFLERYGTAQLVPVTELLHPELGLGSPAGYRKSERSESDPRPDRFRDRVLGVLAQGATLDGRREVELDDVTLDLLADGDDGRIPPVLEVGAHLIASSAHALDEGDFRVVLANMPLSRRAGAVSGRFAYLLDDLRDQSATLWRDAGTAVPAQVAFQTNWSRVSNVARVPRLAGHTLPVGRFADRDDPSVLSLDELVVGAVGGRLFLWSTRLGAEVVPATLHMLIIKDVAPDVVRFVCELAEAGHRACWGWDWGSVAATMPYLPRVRRGRTILASASWRVAFELNAPEITDGEWGRRLDAWRERWRVPAQVYLTNGDNRIGLDLDAPLHRRILRHEITRRPGTVLVEPPGGEGFGSGWLGDRAHEVVVTLRSSAPRPAVRTTAAVRSTAARHRPGGEWLYAKLYASTDRHADLISQRLPVLRDALPESVDRWFFMRYFDPGPHLRIRFHGPRDRLNRDVLPLVHDWAAALCEAGFARTLQLDTYEPETYRYGGPEALAAAERAFHADSEAVMAQLRLRLDLPQELLAAANYVDLARAFHGEGWQEWLLAAYPRGEHHHAFQAIRRRAVAVIGGQDLDPRLAEIWRSRGPAVARYGELVRTLGRPSSLPALLHMHHNRLVGASESSEGASFAMARGAVQALRDRARHAR